MNKSPSKKSRSTKEKTKKSRSKSKTKDENDVKKPLNPYMLFMKDYRAEKKNVKVPMKEISQKWKNLSDSKKKKIRRNVSKK